MDLRQLGYFVHVAELGSFTKAAAMLSVAQSALSHQLRDIEARLARVYRDGQQTSFDIAKAVLDLAAAKAPPEKLQYLEVEEQENARRSFDLNLYNAQLQVNDIHHLLQRMREHFGVRAGQFQALYDQINTKVLGHLAGGVHRDAKDFFNVYYGVVGFPHFNERLG